MQDVTVIKQNPQEVETWRYNGRVIQYLRQGVLIEARFNRDDLPFFGETLRRNDRFLEVFLTSQWFNIFEIRDREDDRLKLWYCNVTRPAQIKDDTVIYVDLALDLAVFPDRRKIVLDEDEFALLDITDEERRRARTALNELQTVFAHPEEFNLVAWALGAEKGAD